MINMKLIDQLKRQEGWQELVKYFSDKLSQAHYSAESSKDKDNAWIHCREAKLYRDIINFMLTKPDPINY